MPTPRTARYLGVARAYAARASCVVGILLTVTSTGFAQDQQGSKQQARVERLRQYVFDLADDSMMGRVVGEPGYMRAAMYVAETLREIGVLPAFYASGESVEGYFHEFDVELERNDNRLVRTYNVVGIVAGHDVTKANEYLVVGAHLDHIGWPDSTQIYNGASDNATGVATVLEVATRLAANPAQQSVMFVFFGAEEVGKKGSLAFVDLMDDAEADLRANVNVDDVGHLERLDDGRSIIGVLHGNLDCPALIDKALTAGSSLGLAVTDIDRKKSFTRSDHYSFFAGGLPVVFLTSGFAYDEYHQPTDVPSSLDYDQLARVTELAYLIVRSVTRNSASCATLER